MGEGPGDHLHDDGFVELFAAGQTVVGEFRCEACGYGVIVHRALPVCPMCGGADWEQGAWSPLTRARRELRLE